VIVNPAIFSRKDFFELSIIDAGAAMYSCEKSSPLGAIDISSRQSFLRLGLP
jgi:hypothetical protein